MENTERRTYKVPVENIYRLRDQVALVNRRVERLRKRGEDVELVVVREGKPYAVPQPGKPDRVYVDVELLSQAPPRIDGWEFVAALTHVEGVGAVLRVVPGAAISEGELKRYREASPDNCDHCRASRKRSDTFVVRDAGGELRQVGRQCLQAYTGLASPGSLCAVAEILFAVSDVLEDSEDEGSGGGGGGPRCTSIACYLPYVACSIRQDGWLSRTAAMERGTPQASTCDLAFSFGVCAKPGDEGKYEPIDKDFNLASAVIEHCEQYFAERTVESLSDYENSLRVAMASGIAHPKLAGLIASSVGFYKRDLERRARKESLASMVRDSKFQGQVKVRGIFEGLKVMAYRTFESDYGAKHFYAMVDGHGNAFAYFASRDVGLEVGQVVSLRGTVKKHEVYTPKYEGAVAYEQTILTRCELVARARVVSEDVVARESHHLVTTNPEEVGLGGQAKFAHSVEKVYRYHLEGSDGRRFLVESSSRKKGLVAGAAAVVSYDGGADSAEECRAGLVSVG